MDGKDEKRRERSRKKEARRRERMATDPEYRERQLERKRASKRRQYERKKQDPEWLAGERERVLEYQRKKSRERYREKLASDPDYRERLRAYDAIRREKEKGDPEALKRRRARTKRCRAKGYGLVMLAKIRGSCVDCGESDPAVLDFDHRDPSEKKFNLSQPSQCTSGRVATEMAKCDIRCSNCHRKRTSVQRNAWHQEYKSDPFRFEMNLKLITGEVEEDEAHRMVDTLLWWDNLETWKPNQED